MAPVRPGHAHSAWKGSDSEHLCLCDHSALSLLQGSCPFCKEDNM